jgi:hypothetical protein
MIGVRPATHRFRKSEKMHYKNDKLFKFQGVAYAYNFNF